MARVAAVPGFGWQPFEPVTVANPVVTGGPGEPVSLANGLVSIEIDERRGTFSLDGRSGTACWSMAVTWATRTTIRPHAATAW